MKPMPPTESPEALTLVIDKEAPAQRIIRALAAALEADMVNRDGSRGPDHRTRVQAATKLLEYRVGRPVERSEIHTTVMQRTEEESMRAIASPTVLSALLNMLSKNPEAMNTLRNMLEKKQNKPAVDV